MRVAFAFFGSFEEASCPLSAHVLTDRSPFQEAVGSPCRRCAQLKRHRLRKPSGEECRIKLVRPMFPSDGTRPESDLSSQTSSRRKHDSTDCSSSAARESRCLCVKPGSLRIECRREDRVSRKKRGVEDHANLLPYQLVSGLQVCGHPHESGL